MLTIFSGPKAFDGHIGIIQENAIGSWMKLHPEVQVLLLGREKGIQQAAEKLGARHIGEIETNDWGTPLVSSMFEQAQRAAIHDMLCFVNTDVILLPDMLTTLTKVQQRFERFLLIGQRWDLAVPDPIVFVNGWQREIIDRLKADGSLHPPAGSDYFVFAAGQIEQMPPFTLGRAGWDNWMIYSSRREEIPVIDATSSITVIHQDHDYQHLPGNQPHYQLPESRMNVRLAGGSSSIFTIRDATWSIDTDGSIHQAPFKNDLVRRAETALLIRLPGRVPAELIYLLFHPVKSFRKARGAIRAVWAKFWGLSRQNAQEPQLPKDAQ